jgi:predicted RNA-binding Zn-ribbon protein involved in translation (DUF1610 family)
VEGDLSKIDEKVRSVKEDARTDNTSEAVKPSAVKSCPNCGSHVRLVRAIQSGRDAVRIYHCKQCNKEFVGQELGRK